MYPPSGPPTPWLGYPAMIGGEVVGTWAFKAPPSEQGVEIAYVTFPRHEGRGIATAMATQLMAIARQAGEYQVHARP